MNIQDNKLQRAVNTQVQDYGEYRNYRGHRNSDVDNSGRKIQYFCLYCTNIIRIIYIG